MFEKLKSNDSDFSLSITDLGNLIHDLDKRLVYVQREQMHQREDLAITIKLLRVMDNTLKLQHQVDDYFEAEERKP